MHSLHLSDATDIQLIDTESKLRDSSELAKGAYVCAIDAEWQPGSQKASATLVQLALKCSSSATQVLLLDLLALPRSDSKNFLQSLFRNRSVLKIGYGLSNDLKAINTALGPPGNEPLAVVHPYIDLRNLSKQLRQKDSNLLPKAGGAGLAGLVESVFSAHLDKRLQCSAWGERPLSKAQMHYAALDAACLLGILQALAFSQLRPTEIQLAPTASARTLESRGANWQEESSDAVSPQGELRNSDDSSTPGRIPRKESDCAKARTCSSAQEANAEGNGLTAVTTTAARDAWGCRLESSGGTAQVIRLSDNRLLPSQDDGGAIHQSDAARLPLRIPWSDATVEARFVADVPQEGLARQLRLCGFDAKVAPNLSKGKRHLVYRFLVETAEQEDRVILTCDKLFVRRRLSDQAFLVQGLDKKAQLAEVLSAFNLKIASSDLLSRCAKCNGKFVPRAMRFLELPEESKKRIPETVVRGHDATFWLCGSCQQVYWRGSQFERCIGHLAARLQATPALSFA